MSNTSKFPEVLGAVAEEFAGRLRRHEQPAISEYVARYPDLAAEILELFPALLAVEQAANPASRVGPAPEDQRLDAINRVGDFRIIREIGRGGMGVVFEAEQESLRRRVALKILAQQMVGDPRHQKRFEREARAAAKLHHTNIVPVFGVGHEGDAHYYAMQFILGQGLDKVLVELRSLRNRSASTNAETPGDAIETPTVAVGAERQAQQVAHSLVTGLFEYAAAPAGFPGDGTDESPGHELKTRVATASAAADSEIWLGGQVSLCETRLGRPSETDLLSGSQSSEMPPQGTETSSRAGRLAYWRSVARIGEQIADALAHAHDQGVLHRDIKPSNLLLDTRGTAWITDFGLAKIHDKEDLTHTGDIVGTLRYMAPEMFVGEADVRSDIYSLGLTLFEMLALQPAYFDSNRQRLIQKVLNDSPARLRTIDPRIPRDLETIVHKAIERDPKLRYQSAAELRDDLQRFQADEPIRARRVTLTTRFRHWCRRNRLIAALTGTVAALLVSAVIGLSVATARFFELANDKELALQDAIAARNEAKNKADEAVRAKTDAELARDEADDQRQLLAENVDLALQALEEVYLQFAEQRITVAETLDETDRRFLEKALSFYEHFTRQKGSDAKTREILARAAHRVGTIQRRLGQYDKAEVSVRRAIELWQSLVLENQSALGTREMLAFARADLGRGIRDSGDAGRSLEPLRQALTECERLSAAGPANLVYRQHVGWMHTDLGIAQQRSGQLDQAEASFRQAAQIFERLLGEGQDNPHWRYAQAYALNNLGNLQRDRQQAVQAEETFTDVLQTYNDLASSAATANDDVTSNLSYSENSYAWMLRNSGRAAEAEAAHRKSIEQFRALFEKARNDPGRRHWLATALMQVSDMCRRPGRWHEALVDLQEAGRLLETLTDVWPENAGYRELRAQAEARRGDAMYGLERFEESDAALHKALEILETVQPPPTGYAGSEKAAILDWLSRSAKRRAMFDEAIAWKLKTVTVLEESVPRTPPTDRWQRENLINHQVALADLLAEQNRLSAAETHYRRARELVDQHAALLGEATVGQQSRTIAWKLAGLAARLNRREEAGAETAALLADLPNAAVDYRIQINTPGLYRLFVRGTGQDGNSDSVLVRIVELCDGPWGRHADFYSYDAPWVAENGQADFHKCVWDDTVYRFEEPGIHTPLQQPALWWIAAPGEYTLRFFMHEDGFALDRFALQLAELPPVTADGPPESSRSATGAFQESSGVLTAEAEHFHARIVSPAGHQWLVVPDESPGTGHWKNAVGGRHLQVLPDGHTRQPFTGVSFVTTEATAATREALNRFAGLCREFPAASVVFTARARLSLRERDWQDAVEELTHVLEHPESEAAERQAWHDRGLARWNLDQFDDALADFDRYFALSLQRQVKNPRDHAAAFSDAGFQIIRSRPDAPAEQFARLHSWFDRALEFDQSFFVWLNRAGLLAHGELFDEALQSYRNALILAEEMQHDRRHAYLALATQGIAYTLHRAGDHARATEWYDFTADWTRALGVGSFGDDRINAEITTRLGPLGEAGIPTWKPGENLPAIYSRLIELAPEVPAGYRLRAKTHREAGRLEEARHDEGRALAAYDQLIEGDTGEPLRGTFHLRFQRGWFLLFELARPADALVDFVTAAEIDPRATNAWNLQGICRNRLGQDELALVAYTKALELAPEDRVLLGNRAATLSRLRQYRLALADWTAALRLNPDDQRARDGRITAAEKLGEIETLLADWTWFIEKNSDSTPWRNRRALVLFAAGRYHAALADWTVCCEQAAAEALYWQNRASAYWELGERDRACADFLQAIELGRRALFLNDLAASHTISRELVWRYPENPRVWLYRAVVSDYSHLGGLALQGDPASVRISLDLAVACAPDDPVVRRVRGESLLARGAVDEAIADLRIATEHVTPRKRPLNFGLESGDLRDWISDGPAFLNQPVRGDTVTSRKPGHRSNHVGEYWVGTYEEQGDEPRGTLSSTPFEVTHPWGSFLVGGGNHPETRVEVVRQENDEVVFSSSGKNSEAMERVHVDLSKLVGRKIFLRLVDQHSGPWGHVNFDDFQFHEGPPLAAKRPGETLQPGPSSASTSAGPASILPEVPLGQFADPGTLALLGRALAQREDFAEAARALTQALRAGAKGFSPWYELAACQLALQDREAYAAACESMISEFRGTTDLQTAEFTVWTCALEEGALADYTDALALARKVVDASPKEQTGRYLTIQAALLLRAGHAHESRNLLTRVVNQAGETTPANTSRAYADYFLALALARAGDHIGARARLSFAHEHADTELATEAVQKPALWNRRLTLRRLRAEAEREVTAVPALGIPQAPTAQAEPAEPVVRRAEGKAGNGKTRARELPEQRWLTREVALSPGEPAGWIARGRDHLLRGRREQAEADLRRGARLQQAPVVIGFWTIGPYPAGLEQFCPPELHPDHEVAPHVVDPAHGLSESPVAWVPAPPRPLGEFDLQQCLQFRGAGSAYLLAYLYADQEASSFVRIEYPSRFRMWFNAELLVGNESQRANQQWEGASRIPLAVRPGLNTLLVKVPLDALHHRGWESYSGFHVALRFESDEVEQSALLLEARRPVDANFRLSISTRSALRRCPILWSQLSRQLLLVPGDRAAYLQECEQLFATFWNGANAENRRWIAQALLAGNHPLVARHWREFVAACDTANPKAYAEQLWAANACLKGGDFEAAKKLLSPAPQGELAPFRDLLQALLAFENRDPETARKLFDQLLDQLTQQLPIAHAPTEGLLLTLLAELESKLDGSAPRAGALWSLVRERIEAGQQGNDPRLKYFLPPHAQFTRYASLYRARQTQLGLLDEAIAQCSAAIDSSSHRGPLLVERGTLLVKLGEFDRAATDFDAALSQAADATQPRWLGGQAIDLRLANFPEVVERVQRLRPDDPGMRLAQMAQAIWRRNWNEAERVVTLFPPAERGRHLALLLLLRGDLPAYEQLRDQLLPVVQGNVYDEVKLLGMAPAGRIQAGRLQELAQAIGRDLEPGNYLQRFVGLAHLRAGRPLDAIHRFEGCLNPREVWANDAWIWSLLALAHHQAGDTGQARIWLEKARTWSRLYEPEHLDSLERALGPQQLSIYDWIMTRITLREAEAVIEGPDYAAGAL